jgi:hypothetical protein
MPSSVLLLELNEVNFDYVRAYVNRGELPTFRRLLSEFSVSITTSEAKYEHLEPWIQWVTAHTGKTFAEHGVFRLGDVEKLGGVDQIWERLEREKSIRVGAISPMNARNALSNGGFFVPDPWTSTHASGSYLLRKMSEALNQAVNENAQRRLTAGSLVWLMAGAAVNARARNYAEYLRLLLASTKHHWMRAMFLDLLLADTFVTQVQRQRPGFASVFLNAAAHIQHHYMFSSPIYDGPHRNPDWYLPAGTDPLLEIYRVYDRVLADIVTTLPAYRLMIATGLHQDPHDELTYYWRLSDHKRFLERARVPFRDVRPLMSRDFVVICCDVSEARIAERRLAAIHDGTGTPVFEVDNRGSDLFVMLVYPRDVPVGMSIRAEDCEIADFRDEVAFVALKNGKHNGAGYFIDMGVPRDTLPQVFELKRLPELIMAAVD